ncbi:MAG: HAMP domain-containing protein, partial [Myxococcales bacterium]|nr:HAMP domain-containing protein [Myxococcales bacterium]
MSAEKPERRARRAWTRGPWWGRLESRVIAALVVLGTLCVGASFYLVTLTVEYFDGLVDDAIATSERAAGLAGPFYDGYVQARKQAYQARLTAMARELEIAELRAGAGATARAVEDRRRRQLASLLEREDDLVELSLRAGDDAITVERASAFPEESGAWVWVPATGATAELAPASQALEVAAPPPEDALERHELSAVFALDPAMDRRYQELGRLQREADLVSVGDDVVTRESLEAAVFRAIGVASALVLLIALIAGFVLARATTRKASALSRVMQRVADGELTARVPELGNDELGQLGWAFNRMLDELAAAQKKLSYLQRVGAWQEMARRIAHEIKNPLTP